MRVKIIVVLALCTFQPGFSQNDSKSILNGVSNIYSSEAGFILDFTLNTEDTKSKTTYTHDGKAYIKGNKFKIDVPDGITWFDGKTQWVYMKGGDEINVSNPTGEELAAISPVALLNLYKSGFKLSNKKEKKENGKPVYVIEMTPQKKGSDISKIILAIEQSTNYIASITLQGKDKVNNHLLIKKHLKATALSDKTFVFNKKEYPNLEVVDLR
ncbi:outer membrane lipoprotein periplasmic chaperone LolA1 [Viscerimonas tarda]